MMSFIVIGASYVVIAVLFRSQTDRVLYNGYTLALSLASDFLSRLSETLDKRVECVPSCLLSVEQFFARVASAMRWPVPVTTSLDHL